MLLQFKVYMISVLYFFGAVFILVFPPRNYELSGAKVRVVRSASTLKYKQYVEQEALEATAQRLQESDPDVVRVVRLRPLTSQNRTIIALELRSDRQSRKPGILIVGALNAMAWGACNTILEFAERLLYDASYQTPYFNDYDWYLIPCVNPDGISFARSLRTLPPVDSMLWSKNVSLRATHRPHEWYKNMQSDSLQDLCFGTNINRNFAHHWQDDVRKTPEGCSQNYPGSWPFSTPEAQAVRTYVGNLGQIIHLAIHLHASFVPKKEYILYPWRYSTRHHSNYRTLQAIGEYAARQARLPDGRVYEVHQSSYDGPVAGSLCDYISGVVGTDLVYLIKPYHQLYPNDSNIQELEVYARKSIAALLGVVRGWRSSTKVNTLSFFGTDIEF